MSYYQHLLHAMKTFKNNKEEKFAKLHIRESLNMEVCMSNKNQLSELIREENSQTAGHCICLWHCYEIKCRNNVRNSKEEKNIHNLLNLNI